MVEEARAPARRHAGRTAVRIALIYALIGVLWIVFSDQALEQIFRSSQTLTHVQSVKGVFYIVVTAILLYWLVRRDMAAIENALERIRISEARYRSIVEAAGNAILGLDQELRVREWNSGAEEILGWRKDEVIGREYLPLAIPPDQRQSVAGAIRAALDGERIRGYANDVLTREGQVRHMVWNANALAPNGAGQREVIAIGEDLTVRMNLEAQLYQAQKMEALGLLASGISHDINNVLTAIMGCTDLARGAMDDVADRPENVTEQLDQIEQSAQRAAMLTRQLLTFGRRGVVHAELFDPKQRLVGLEGMLRRLVHENIEMVIEPDEAWPIRMDPGQFEQLVMNLVVNARDAMPRGGRMTMGLRNVDLGVAHHAKHPDARLGPHVQLVVSDTGAGMDAQTLQRIFEPFFTTKAAGQGTGLGLATVHGIVRQLGGHIDLASEVGVGTTFRIYLPAEPEASVGAPAKAERPPLRGHETVLLCEDDDLIRRLAERALRDQGYRVLSAKAPSAALRLLDEAGNRLDLLVTNVALPEIDGVELAECVSERCPSAAVLFISGYGEDVVAEHGGTGDDIAFLGKPFTAEQIARRVREVLAARTASPQA